MARKKEFDTMEALTKAMVVFWTRGYEKTSMQDLVDAMGIHRGSIYDTFGDKKQLFEASLNLYEQMVQTEITKTFSPEMSLVEKLRMIFMFAISNKDTSHPGCLLVNSATELSLVDPIMGDKINGLLANEEEYLLELLKEGQVAGELDQAADVEMFATYLHNTLVGLRVLVKMKRDSEKLQGIIEHTLLGLPIIKKIMIENGEMNHESSTNQEIFKRNKG